MESDKLTTVSEARRKFGSEAVGRLMECGWMEIKRTTIGPTPRYGEYLRVHVNALEEMGNWLSTQGKRDTRQSRLVTRLMESGASVIASEMRREFSGAIVKILVERGWLKIEKIANGPRYVECLHASMEGQKAQRISQIVTRLMESNELMFASETRKKFGSAAVKTLVDRGWLEIEKTQVFRDPLADRVFEPEPPVLLSPGQSAITADVIETLRDSDRRPRVFLVQGVTGSGKTEIYLRAVEECLALGKQAVVMVA